MNPPAVTCLPGQGFTATVGVAIAKLVGVVGTPGVCTPHTQSDIGKLVNITPMITDPLLDSVNLGRIGAMMGNVPWL